MMSVTGPKDIEQIGICQGHEHLFISKGVSYEINPAIYMDEMDKTVEEIRRFQKAGGQTLVDAQPGGCNRMPEELREASLKTGATIVASTGFHKMMFYPEVHWIHTFNEKELYQVFISELTEGMYINCDNAPPQEQISAQAGMVKTAYDIGELSGTYPQKFRAAAHAAMEASVPMVIHIEQGTNPVKLLDFLLSEAIRGERLIFSHMDRSIEPEDYYTSVLDKGVTLGFDTIGRFRYHSDEDEIQLIKRLFDLGYERIICSLDTTRERMKAYSPEAIGLDYMLTSFIPQLAKAGVTKQQIEKILSKNCINLFS